MLEKFKNFFGPQVGKIFKNGSNLIQYRVESIKKLQPIINHFDKYNLITNK
jgi:hypothetical protein